MEGPGWLVLVCYALAGRAEVLSAWVQFSAKVIFEWAHGSHLQLADVCKQSRPVIVRVAVYSGWSLQNRLHSSREIDCTEMQLSVQSSRLARPSLGRVNTAQIRAPVASLRRALIQTASARNVGDPVTLQVRVLCVDRPCAVHLCQMNWPMRLPGSEPSQELTRAVLHSRVCLQDAALAPATPVKQEHAAIRFAKVSGWIISTHTVWAVWL